MILPLHKSLQTTVPTSLENSNKLAIGSIPFHSIGFTGCVVSLSVLVLALTSSAGEPTLKPEAQTAKPTPLSRSNNSRSTTLRRGGEIKRSQQDWSKPRLIIDSRGDLQWSRPERIIIEKFHNKEPSFLNPPADSKPLASNVNVAESAHIKKAAQIIELGNKKRVDLEPIGTPFQTATNTSTLLDSDQPIGTGFSINPPTNRHLDGRPVSRHATRPRQTTTERKIRKPALVALQPMADSESDDSFLDDLPLDDNLLDDLEPADGNKDPSPATNLETDDSEFFNRNNADQVDPAELDELPMDDSADDLPSAEDLGFGDEEKQDEVTPGLNGFSGDEELSPELSPKIEDDTQLDDEVRIPEGSNSNDTPDESDVEDADLTLYNGRNCPEDLRLYQKAWNTFRRRPLSDISLDITPRFEPNAEPAEAAKMQAETLADSAARDWKGENGELLAFGKIEDFRDGVLLIRNGAELKNVNFHKLSNDDICYVNAWWGTPTEYRPEGRPYEVRNWTMTTFTWKASGLCHKPLYFEEVQLERYGHSAGPVKQSFLSGAHFFGNIFFLPYHIGMNPPNECQYALGYYRPGDCAPWLLHAVPLSARGARMQLGAIVGGISLVP